MFSVFVDELERKGILEAQHYTVSLRIWLLINSDFAVDHGHDAIAELKN